MSKKIHYVDGCPWASGHIQCADTIQTKDWNKVTCKHCRKNKPWILLANLNEFKNWDKPKMNRKVVVDIDGVIADFEYAFCQKFGNEHRELVSLESRYPAKARQITKFINDGFVYKDLEPIQTGLDICEWLDESGFDVCIVTARPFGFESLTRAWLKRHNVHYSSFISTRPKEGQIAIMQPLCAVDDLYSVHKALLWHNIPTILAAHPWNNYIGENLTRIHDLGEFILAFEQVLENYSKKGE